MPYGTRRSRARAVASLSTSSGVLLVSVLGELNGRRSRAAGGSEVPLLPCFTQRSAVQTRTQPCSGGPVHEYARLGYIICRRSRDTHQPALRHAKSAPLGPHKRSFTSDNASLDSDDPPLSEKHRHVNVALAHHIAHRPPPPPPPTITTLQLALPSPTAGLVPSKAATPADTAYARFLNDYPEYAASWPLDALRMTEYTRLKPDEAYVDYMGGALYPTTLVTVHADFLRSAVLGNTHSESSSSKLSAALASSARAAVLQFFNAPPGSSVVFTANASAALKLVGEAFPFAQGSPFLLPEDAHNSVHGIRAFAAARGANIVYMPASVRGGVRVKEAQALMHAHRPSKSTPALFAFTGLSNLTNTKSPLTLLARARALGYRTLLDAAALAPTTPIDLTRTPVDAVAVSFYKMFGFPTGIGALVVGPGMGEWLVEGRPWFAGGGVDVVQVPGMYMTRKTDVSEAFEDGTINYTLLPGVTTGLRLLSAYIQFLPARIAALTAHSVAELERVTWPNGAQVVQVLSRVPRAGRRRHAEEVADQKRDGEEGELASGAGGVVSCIFLDDTGTQIPLSQIASHAALHNIALRTGCMCNPGGAAALLALAPLMAALHTGATLAELERRAGRELGVVRISFGLGSAWKDVWKVVRWVRAGVDSAFAVPAEVGRAF